MSFLSALGAFMGGRAKANQQQFENARETQGDAYLHERNADTDAETRRMNDAYLAQNASAQQAAHVKAIVDARANGLDVNGNPLPPLAIPKSMQQVVPNNGGYAQPGDPRLKVPADEMLIRHYNQLQAEAIKQNRPDLADQYKALAGAIGGGAKTIGGVGVDQARVGYYGSQGDVNAARVQLYGTQGDVNRARVGLIHSQASLADAHAEAARTAQATAIEIASGHDKSALVRAATEVQGRVQVAGMTNDGKIAVTKLAAAYRVAGKSVDEAAKIAKSVYENRYRKYLQDTNAKNEILNPGAGAAAVEPTYGTAPPPAPPGAAPSRKYGTVHTANGSVRGYSENGQLFFMDGRPAPQ
ncbi:MAG: hypothetical protein NVS1B2_15730 [Vulcanimicrobiaceae bacterium]